MWRAMVAISLIFQNTSATDYRPVGFTDENNAVIGSIGYDTTTNVFALGDSLGRSVYLTAGNVGIGTTGPLAPLDLGDGTLGRAITWEELLAQVNLLLWVRVILMPLL